MLRSRTSSFKLLAMMMAALFVLQGCGDDSDRAKIGNTTSSNLSELRLKQLIVSPGALSPAFDPDSPGPYYLELDSDVSSIDISAAPKADNVLMETRRMKVLLEDDGSEDSSGILGVEVRPIEAGDVDTRSLQPGDNKFVVRVSEKGKSNLLSYTIIAHRDNVDPRLREMNFQYYQNAIAATDTTEAVSAAVVDVSLTPTFDSDVNTYTGAVPYEACRVRVGYQPVERHTRVAVNGSPTGNSQYNTFEMPVGEQAFTFVTTPEVGDASDTYSVTLTRAAGTSAQLAKDATLASLTVTNAEFPDTFHCQNNYYGGQVNVSVTDFDVTVAPSVEGAVLRIGIPVWEDTDGDGVDDAVTALEEGALTLSPGVPLTQSLGEASEYERAIEVTATDGTTQKYYRLYLVQRVTNWVSVASAEELQAALLNAEPLDEIRLAPGVYNGVASTGDSGNAESHFYTARSGTEDARIYLRSESLSDRARLQGPADSPNSVLMLAGDYWVVSGIDVSGARNGITLDAANKNTLSGCKISSVGERGLVIRNGSSDNVIVGCAISNTGVAPRAEMQQNAEAVVVGVEPHEWSTAADGTMNEQVLDNVLHRNTFGPDVRAEAVDIKAGARRTRVQYNTVDARGISAAEDDSLIVVKGNNSDISYNTFVNKSSAVIAQLVSAKNVAHDWINEDWGENTRFYENFADLPKQDIPLANSHDVAVLDVAENRRQDQIEVRYAGEGINNAFTVPVYQIQASSEAGLCLSVEKEVADQAVPTMTAETCADTSEQHWKFVNAGEGFVFMSPVVDLDARVMGMLRGFDSDILSPVYSWAWDVTNLDAPYMFNWKLVYLNDGTTIIRSRTDWYSRQVISAPKAAGSAIVTSSVGLGSQEFYFIEQ